MLQLRKWSQTKNQGVYQEKAIDSIVHCFSAPWLHGIPLVYHPKAGTIPLLMYCEAQDGTGQCKDHIQQVSGAPPSCKSGSPTFRKTFSSGPCWAPHSISSYVANSLGARTMYKFVRVRNVHPLVNQADRKDLPFSL